MSEQITFPVKFGSVTTSNATKTRIGAKIERKNINLKDLDRIFCGHRVRGVLKNHRDADGQKRLEGMEEADGSIEATFDCGGFSTTPDSCSLSLLLNKSDVGHGIDDFAGIEGQLTVLAISEIPDEDRAAASAPEPDDHPDLGPIAKPLPGQKRLLKDPGGAMSLAVLKDFGLTKSKCETLIAHVEVQTGGVSIAHFEAMQRKQEYWYRDIKGFGGEWITKLQDAHLAFRTKYPMPDPDEPSEPKDGVDIFKASPAPEEKAEKLPVVESNGEAKLK